MQEMFRVLDRAASAELNWVDSVTSMIKTFRFVQEELDFEIYPTPIF